MLESMHHKQSIPTNSPTTKTKSSTSSTDTSKASQVFSTKPHARELEKRKEEEKKPSVFAASPFTLLADLSLQTPTPTRMHYVEKWDLPTINVLLSTPGALSLHDRRIVAHVKANASADGQYYVSYKYGKKLRFGRIYSARKLGYQGLSKVMRRRLCACLYAEDDVYNSYPTIMLHLFKKANLPTRYLETYTLEREQLFKDMRAFGTREQIKELFIIALFQGDYLYHNDRVPIPFLTKFQHEVKTNAKAFLTEPPFSHFLTLATRNKSDKPLRTALSYVCQIEEGKIQRAKVVYTEFCQLRVVTDLYDDHLREHGDLRVLGLCSIGDRL